MGPDHGSSPRSRKVFDKVDLFKNKLKSCCVVYDFRNTTQHLGEKDAKTKALHELIGFLNLASLKFDVALVEEIVKMVSANLFGTFRYSSQDKKLPIEVWDDDEDERFVEPSWPHLELVYDFFLKFLSSVEMDANVAKRHMDNSFLFKLLELFDSEDKRERGFLMSVTHKIYGKLWMYRFLIRKEISNIFYQFILETGKHNGIAELLEVLASIVGGFDLPLKEEHKVFLDHKLLTLHKSKCFTKYHKQLSRCIMEFVKKDPRLSKTVIFGILRYWPMTNSVKEFMLLGELEQIVEAIEEEEFQHFMVPLFHQIGRCINSSPFQVADGAFFPWTNGYIWDLTFHNRCVILPIILPYLERSSRSHWYWVVLSKALKVKEILSEADQEFFDECSARIQEDEIEDAAAKEKRALTWKQLEDMAASKAVCSKQAVS